MIHVEGCNSKKILFIQIFLQTPVAHNESLPISTPPTNPEDLSEVTESSSENETDVDVYEPCLLYTSLLYIAIYIYCTAVKIQHST